MDSDVKEYVIEKIEDLVGPTNFSEGTSLNNIQVDGVDRIELAMELEDEYNIIIIDEEIDGWQTVKDIIDMVVEKTK
jgi:acyl carrier protein